MVTYGEAVNIVANIDSESYSNQEKIEAVYTVLDLAKDNGITKKMYKGVIKWLLHYIGELAVMGVICDISNKQVGGEQNDD